MSDDVITSFRRAVFAVSNVIDLWAGEITPRPESPLNKTRKNLEETPEFFKSNYNTKNTKGFSKLVVFETRRDGTVLTCLAGNVLKTGRDGTVK